MIEIEHSDYTRFCVFSAHFLKLVIVIRIRKLTIDKVTSRDIVLGIIVTHVIDSSHVLESETNTLQVCSSFDME